MRTLVLPALCAAALLVPAAAAAKDFEPGDLRVCDAARCVPIVDRAVLPQLGSFYYGGPPPARAPRPALGAPYYELRFRNGYVTGIAATVGPDRFLSYGVNLGRFSRGAWYALPRPLAAELRRLTAGLRPLHLARAALAKSR